MKQFWRGRADTIGYGIVILLLVGAYFAQQLGCTP